MIKPFSAGALLAALMIPMTSIADLEVKITPETEFVVVSQGNELVKIQRIQDTDNRIDGAFAKTSRACPPFCINPLEVAEGVTTVAELEVMTFMDTRHGTGKGIIVDARTPSWYNKGTIPGSVNIPFTQFEKDMESIELAEALEALGAVERDEVGSFMRMMESVGLFDGDEKTEKWDFSDAKDVLLWCNGPWCGQSPRAIRALISVGYPADKLYYYRGGMQMWQSLGLTTVKPNEQSVIASNAKL